MIVLKTPKTNIEWKIYHEIRKRILWVARGVVKEYAPLYPDEYLSENHPKILISDNEISGTIRIDLNVSSKEAIYRKVAIIEIKQRKRLGRVLMGKAEYYAIKNGCNQFTVYASLDAVEFYRKIGYVVDSDSTENDPGNIKMIK